MRVRYREIADIASTQIQSLTMLRKDRDEEKEELRRHCIELESRSDDDTIIGRLQRMLMSTKASYRAFARKHEIARSNLRRKEAMIRALETRLDEREVAVYRVHEESRQRLAILRRALQMVMLQGLDEGAEEKGDGQGRLSSAKQSLSLFDRAKVSGGGGGGGGRRRCAFQLLGWGTGIHMRRWHPASHRASHYHVLRRYRTASWNWLSCQSSETRT